jgi:hypothetical protein
MAFEFCVIIKKVLSKTRDRFAYFNKSTLLWKMGWEGAGFRRRSQEANYEAVSIMRSNSSLD